MYILYICPTNPEARAMYEAAAAAYNARPYSERDAGFDLFSAAGKVAETKTVTKLSQQVRAAFLDKLSDTVMLQYRAYWMLPRSSISKTTMMLANSVGLIDAGYRGEIIAAVRSTTEGEVFEVKNGERYFQLSSPDLLPWHRVEVVDEIPGGPTVRGEGGFGSTGTEGVATHSGAPTGGAGSHSLSHVSFPDNW